MKIITCASYHGSGSSAVTDLISEYKGLKSLTDYEFRFVQDPDGISELEYNLVENFNRHNSGHALKRYKKLVDYHGKHLLTKRYEPFFNNQWKKLSYEYIDSLTDFKFPGFWDYDFYDKGPFYEFWAKLPLRVLRRTIWRKNPDREIKFPRNIETLASHPTEEKFLECTRNYMDKLMKAANTENEEIMMVDQILPSSNLKRHMRYFNDIQAIIVDRDPRDVYLLAKYEWHNNVVPTDIDVFCKWYGYTHATQSEEVKNDKVLLVHFEDLIYKYEESKEKLSKWIGLTEADHVKPGEIFKPEVSIKNTRYWEQHPEYKDQADYVAERLPQYLYEIEK